MTPLLIPLVAAALSTGYALYLYARDERARLSTVVDAHQILVMELGRILERGTHAELLARRRRRGGQPSRPLCQRG